METVTAPAGGQAAFFNTKANAFTDQATAQLRAVFNLYAQSSKASLKYEEFATMYEITNDSKLPLEVFQTLVHPEATLSFQSFTGLYADVYTDEGVQMGDQNFYTDVRKLTAAYKTSTAKEKENQIFVSPKTVKPSRVRESTASGRENVVNVRLEEETKGFNAKGEQKAKNEQKGNAVAGACTLASQKKRKTIASVFVKTNKKAKGGLKPKKKTSGFERMFGQKQKKRVAKAGAAAPQTAEKSDAAPPPATEMPGKRVSLKGLTGAAREDALLETENFFLTMKEKGEKEAILKRKRRESVARTAQETLRKDLMKQRQDHANFFAGKAINPFFKTVADRSQAARKKAASVVDNSAKAGLPSVQNESLLPRPVSWSLTDPSFCYHPELGKVLISKERPAEKVSVPQGTLLETPEPPFDTAGDAAGIPLCRWFDEKLEIASILGEEGKGNQAVPEVAQDALPTTLGEIPVYLEREDVQRQLDRMLLFANSMRKVEALPAVSRGQTFKLARTAIEKKLQSRKVVSAEKADPPPNGGRGNNSRSDDMWSHKYRPMRSSEVCGNAFAASSLVSWLKDFQKTRDESSCSSWDYYYDSDSDEEEENSSIVLMVGPCGAGKSAAVYACAAELGYEVIEVNASSTRGRSKILQLFGEATQSHRLPGIRAPDPAKVSDSSLPPEPKKRKVAKKRNSNAKQRAGKEAEQKSHASKSSIILFEEVDNVAMFEDAGDRGFFSAVQNLAKRSKRPIILTANTITEKLSNMKIKTIPFAKMPVSEVLQEAHLVCVAEGLKFDVVNLYLMTCLFHCDLRRIILTLQFWGKSNSKVSLKPVLNLPEGAQLPVEEFFRRTKETEDPGAEGSIEFLQFFRELNTIIDLEIDPFSLRMFGTLFGKDLGPALDLDAVAECPEYHGALPIDAQEQEETVPSLLPARRHQSVEVRFEGRGPLGLTLIETDNEDGLKIEGISNDRFTGSKMKNTIISPGWYLTHVNGVCVHSKSLAATGKIIKKAKRPMVVVCQNFFSASPPTNYILSPGERIAQYEFLTPVPGTTAGSETKDATTAADASKGSDSATELNKLVQFYESMSFVDIVSRPRRETCQGPEGKTFRQEWGLLQNPRAWHENPMVRTEPRNEDVLGEHIGRSLRGAQLADFQLFAKREPEPYALHENTVKGHAIWNEEIALLNLAGVEPSNALFYKAQSRGKELVETMEGSLPLRTVGVAPGSFCRHNVLLYAGIVRKMNMLENMRRKISKKRRFSHYFDTVCLDFDSSLFLHGFCN
jgi:hypothetical protein